MLRWSIARRWLSAQKWSALAIPLFVLAIAAFAFAGSQSSSYQECERSPEQQAIWNARTSGLHRFSLLINCEAAFLNANGGAITGVASVLLAWITYLLVGLGREQGRTTRAQLRAYVSAIPEQAFFEADGRLGIIVQLKNVGVTPAFETQCLWDWRVMPRPGRDEVEFNFTNPESVPIATFVLYPDSGNKSVKRHMLTSAMLAQLEDGYVIHAFGMVFYIDAFGEKQWGKFSGYMTKTEYDLWLYNYKSQPEGERRPVAAPFKFTEGNNRASFQ
jgi:hypothetical protein